MEAVENEKKNIDFCIELFAARFSNNIGNARANANTADKKGYQIRHAFPQNEDISFFPLQ